MMKHIRNISSLFILLASFVLVSCFEDPGTDILIEGAFVEIAEATTAQAQAGGFDVSKSYDRLNDGIAKRDTITVNLVGAQRSTPITINFEIDASSTAVAGVHYNMISVGSVQIAANSSFGYIIFEVLADNIEPSEVWKLRINLTSADGGVKLSTNYDSFTRSIRIACPFVRSNFLGLFNANEPGYGDYDVTFTADPANANAIVADNFWDFGGVVTYVFNTSTATLTLPTQDVVMGGVTYVVAQGAGTATYDACVEFFVVPYTVNRKSDNALFDSNVHTFTKK